MVEMNEKMSKIILTIALIIVSLLSIFVVSPIVSNQEIHSKTIEILDAKKMKVIGWSTGAVGAATIIAAIPGDATTPLANQILRLSSYFLIVIGAIFLEKILLTLTGYLAFTFLIPISCVLVIIYLYGNKEYLKKLAIKLTVFGLATFLVVPTSVFISNKIELTYEPTINQSIKEVENLEKTDKTSSKNSITSKIQEGLSNIGEGASKTIKKGEKMLSDLTDSIAIFIITSCVIPIFVILIFVWIIKIVFNVTIPNFSIKKNK